MADRTIEREQSDAHARQRSIAILSALFDSRRFDREIDMHLAVGEVCPFSRWGDCQIWLAEFNRIAIERGYFK
jgi:hypothetical protein